MTNHARWLSGSHSRTSGGIRNTCSRSHAMKFCPITGIVLNPPDSTPFTRQPRVKGALSVSWKECEAPGRRGYAPKRPDLADLHGCSPGCKVSANQLSWGTTALRSTPPRRSRYNRQIPPAGGRAVQATASKSATRSPVEPRQRPKHLDLSITTEASPGEFYDRHARRTPEASRCRATPRRFAVLARRGCPSRASALLAAWGR